MTDIIKNIANEDWDYLGEFIRMFEFKIKKESEENRKLKKEVEMIKKYLSTLLSEKNKEKIINAEMLVKTYKTIKKLEKKIDYYDSEYNQFIMVLKAIYEKLKKEKLIVHKNHRFNAQVEFEELKRLGEDEPL